MSLENKITVMLNVEIFLKGVVECRKSEDCIKMIKVVSIGWTVVAGSVVGVGIHSTG